MKKIFSFLLMLMVLFSTVSFGQTVYGIYEFTGTSTGDNQLNEVTTQPSFGSFSTITRTNVNWVSGANLFVSSAWSQATTRDDAEYISFSLTLSSSNTFSDNTLTLMFDNYRTTSGPADGEVMYRFGSNSFTSAGTWTMPTSTANYSFTISNPGNAAETYLEIRIHGWNATAGTGNMKLDDVQLSSSQLPLPVELVSFTGAVVNNAVLLNWETATEVNNYGFSIERKILNGNWTSIGFVNGHGNSNSPKHYSFTDYTSSPGSINYRLKQIDFNGTYEYSPIVTKNINEPSQLLLKQNYPNPFNPTTVISYQLPKDGFVTLKVHDILGKEVVSLVSENKHAGYYNATFNASNLPSGIYIYSLQANGFNQSKKMLLVK